MNKVVVHELKEGWVVTGCYVDGGDLEIPCDDFETAIRILALCHYDRFVVKFLNGTSMYVGDNTLEVR